MTIQLWKALSEDIIDRQPLIQVAVWTIGEYGDLLINGNIEDSNDIPRPSEEEVINVYERLLRTPQNMPTTKQYTLMSLMKLSTRFYNYKLVFVSYISISYEKYKTNKTKNYKNFIKIIFPICYIKL